MTAELDKIRNENQELQAKLTAAFDSEVRVEGLRQQAVKAYDELFTRWTESRERHLKAEADLVRLRKFLSDSADDVELPKEYRAACRHALAITLWQSKGDADARRL